MSFYSLVKPPRGSNVSGGEILNSLIHIKPNTELTEKLKFENKLDELLDSGDFSELTDHTYFEQTCVDNNMSNNIDSSALTYFVGYVVRQARKFSIAKSCEECFKTLIKCEDFEDHDCFTLQRSRGNLFIPSDILLNLIYTYEQAIVKILEKDNFQQLILFEGKKLI